MRKQSTTKGLVVLSAATVIVKLLSLIYIPFLKNIISLDGFGVYSRAYTIFAWIYVLANAGIPSAISKLVSEQMALGKYRDAVKSFKIARLLMLILGAIFSLILFVFSNELATMFESSRAALSLMSLAPTLLFTSVLSAYRGYFQGRGNMQLTAVSQVIEQVVNTIFTVVFAAVFVKYGVEAGAAGGTLGTSIGAFISAVFMIFMYEKNKIIVVPKGFEDKSDSSNREILRKILYYGLPLVVCVGLQYSGNVVDMKVVVSRLKYIGFTEKLASEQFALLTAYRTLLGVPIALISALQVSVLPSLSGASALKNRDIIESKINYSLRFCFIIAVPAAVGLAVLGKPLFVLLTGEPEGAKLLYFGAIVLILNSVVLIQTTILQSIGKMYLSTFYIVMGIVGKIIVNYALVGIPEINILGAVFGNFIMFAIPLILNYRLINKLLGIRVTLVEHFIKPFVSSVFMGIIVFGVFTVIYELIGVNLSLRFKNVIVTVIAIGVGVVTYTYGLILARGVTKRDVELLPEKLRGIIPKVVIDRIS